ncbi:MAG: GYD domain-containing protein [Candidatus Bathyarchaeota archaeon]|nr:GYD domain-containing protein [Candidatus Bathyarchaeota archaeon]
MIFITLTKWKKSPKKEKEIVDKFTKKLEELEKQGIKWRIYWTLGHYDAVSIIEAPSEKNAMRELLPFVNIVDSETMVAIPREEAIKLL